jgi:uncharacterized membrane protein YccC
MDLRLAKIRRFLYSHYFFAGIRQGVGMLLPVLFVGSVFDHYTIGLMATFGALCLAIIDQPGGPQRHRTNQMLGAAVLGTGTVMMTGIASSYPLLLWAVVIAQCFFYSLFSVFGKRGSLIGFACLLLMVLTMHSPMPLHEVLVCTAATFCGALSYLAFSLGFSRLFQLREEQQALSMALFATADYVAARANFYDENADLDESYRSLIQRQSAMIEQHQAAREMVLRALPRGRGAGDRRRVMIWNMFTDMLQLLDPLVAMHTDYAVLRRSLAGNDCLMFIRDALIKISLGLNHIALGLSRGRPVCYRSSVKAELRAIEHELEQLKKQGFGEVNPAILAIILQVLRRLRNSARVVDRLAEHTAAAPNAVATGAPHLDRSLTRFLLRQEFRLGMLTSNLRLDSPHFRYAVRMVVATTVAMTLPSRWLSPTFAAHDYWILVTLVIIMKPGFALTRQRNRWRLTGTLMGCLLALCVFQLTDHPSILFAVLLLACIMGSSLVQINYMGSAVFNTLFVVLALHFVSPDSVSLAVIGERAVDTLIGCTLAFLCSYILPWWEASYLRPLARVAVAANREYLQAGLRYVRARQIQATQGPAEGEALDAKSTEADVAWRLAPSAPQRTHRLQ